MCQEYHTPMTALDEMVSDGNLQMLKASMPYLPGSGQRFLSFYTKLLELKHTMELFSRPQDLTACELSSASTVDPASMLNDIRRFCDPNMQKNIDQVLNMLVMVELIETFKDEPGSQ